jgi:hypothetical protein
MALRNAFDLIATEGTLRKLLDQLRFSKDSADRMRVAVDTWPGSLVVYGNGSNTVMGSTAISPYASTSWNIMDARAEFQELSLQAAQIQRNRWTIT